MKMGAERLLDNLLTFLSPFLYTQYHHLAFEVILHWPIPTFGPIRQRHLGQSSSCIPAKQISSQERIVKFDTNAKPIGVDNRCSACISLISRTSLDPSKIQIKPLKALLGLDQTIPRLAHYIGSGRMIQGRCIPSKSPIHTTSPNVN